MKTGNSLEYSAGAVSKGFWFQQFKKYNSLLKKGFTDREIKEQQYQDNILMAPSPSYGKRMINEVSRRSRALPNTIQDMFFGLSVENQKILNLLGVMMTDRLFFEYMYEVYREKLIIGSLGFDSSDTRIFLKNKSEESEKVSNFTPQTKKRLAGAYRSYLKEADLLIEEKNTVTIKKPILDLDLEKVMKNEKLGPYLRIFMGE